MGTPIDRTNIHSWFFEPVTSENGRGSLTIDGVENIANHKYKGGQYTFFDNLLNPFWQYLTELLPITLAPNMVTTIGGIHCAIAYVLMWYYSPQFDNFVPDWVVFFSGYCSIAYYTLDCMDGKQARRTGTSSPLGQLFDHGFDCLNNVVYIALVSSFTMCGRSKSYLFLQVMLQFGFFTAQWEEYYIHVLPHALGNFGVTEINYGIGIFTVMNSFVNRELIWKSRMEDIIPVVIGTYLPPSVGELEFRYFSVLLAGILFIPILLASFHRVLNHENVCKNQNHFSAVSKLGTPFLIGVTPFLLPESVIQNDIRYVSIATALVFCLLTVKMICFSMAKMTYASFQLEALPYFLICLWIRLDENITELGISLILRGLCLWYAYRMLNLAKRTINQICDRLDIFCFSIKAKKVE